MHRLRALADDDLCHRGCLLNFQSIGNGFDTPPSRRACPDTIVRTFISRLVDVRNFATL